MAANPSRRQVFINSVMDFCKKNDFDGIDLDWKDPSIVNSDTDITFDKSLFTNLTKELSQRFRYVPKNVES